MNAEKVQPPAKLDYAAPPRDDGPRPTVALWVAAGLVWFVTGAAGAAALAALIFAGPLLFMFLLPALLFLGIFALEWHAVVRRSLACATVIFAVSAAYAGLALILLFTLAGSEVGSERSRSRREEAASFALTGAVAGFIAVTHERWSARLRDRSEGRR